MKLSVRELVFGAPRLLEWLGWSITKRPHLLGMPSQPYCNPRTMLICQSTNHRAAQWMACL